jgi:hypothetical protein
MGKGEVMSEHDIRLRGAKISTMKRSELAHIMRLHALATPATN